MDPVKLVILLAGIFLLTLGANGGQLHQPVVLLKKMMVHGPADQRQVRRGAFCCIDPTMEASR